MNMTQALAFLDSILAHSPAGYALVDRDLRFAAVNEQLAEINGLPAASHLGKLVSEVLGPNLWASRKPLFERALAGEEITDLRLPGRWNAPEQKNGRVLVSYYPMRAGAVDSEILGVAIMVRDVTEQARAEAALAVREQEYRLIFDANPQPMWVYDVETLHFLDVNDAAVAFYGYSRSEFLSMTIADIRPPEDRSSLIASVMLRRDGAWKDGPWRHLRRDGSAVWVEIAATSLRFQNRAARLILLQQPLSQLGDHAISHGTAGSPGCCPDCPHLHAAPRPSRSGCRGGCRCDKKVSSYMNSGGKLESVAGSRAVVPMAWSQHRPPRRALHRPGRQ